MKDAGQKETVFKHFLGQGWFAIPEVPVYFSGGEHEAAKLVTDIDVFCLRRGMGLAWDVVLADCKTLKGQSPANRAIWLNGLMQVYKSAAGLIVLQRRKNQPIESDHKLFASTLGISIVDETEFEIFDRALVYPKGTGHVPYHANDVTELWRAKEAYPKLASFVDFLSCDAWHNLDYISLLRTSIGKGKSVACEIDPKKPIHLALVLEAIAVFSVGLASCCGLIFQRYLHPESEQALSEALKIIIWGGKERYEFVATLRGQLLEAKGIKPQDDQTLALPNWSEFVQLVRKVLENPKVAFDVPHLMHIGALDIRIGQPFLKDLTRNDLEVLQFAMLSTKYFVRACRYPLETYDKILHLCTDRLSAIVHQGST